MKNVSITVLLLLSLMVRETDAHAPQVVGNVRFGGNECPVWEEGRTCDDLSVELENLFATFVVELFLNGIEDVREVRFGFLQDENFCPAGWAVCPDGFIDMVTDTVAGPELEVTLTAMNDCHSISDGMHFLMAFTYPGHSGETGTVRVVPDPRIGRAQVTTCDDEVITIPEDNLVIIGLGGAEGLNPCKDAVPLRRVSWSSMKDSF